MLARTWKDKEGVKHSYWDKAYCKNCVENPVYIELLIKYLPKEIITNIIAKMIFEPPEYKLNPWSGWDYYWQRDYTLSNPQELKYCKKCYSDKKNYLKRKKT